MQDLLQGRLVGAYACEVVRPDATTASTSEPKNSTRAQGLSCLDCVPSGFVCALDRDPASAANPGTLLWQQWKMPAPTINGRAADKKGEVDSALSATDELRRFWCRQRTELDGAQLCPNQHVPQVAAGSTLELTLSRIEV